MKRGWLTIRLTKRGSLTVPAALRRGLGLQPGSPVRVLLASSVPAPPSQPSPSLLRSRRDAWTARILATARDECPRRDVPPLPLTSQAAALVMLCRRAGVGRIRPSLPLEELFGALAKPCRRAVLWHRRARAYAPPSPSTAKRHKLRGWRFSDGSHVLLVPKKLAAAIVTPYVAVDANGLGDDWMLDHASALRAAFEADRQDLVVLYVACHRALPPLERQLLVRALESPDPAVRLAAITSLPGLKRAAEPPAAAPSPDLPSPPDARSGP